MATYAASNQHEGEHFLFASPSIFLSIQNLLVNALSVLLAQVSADSVNHFNLNRSTDVFY
jgi:hypothetical protein